MTTERTPALGGDGAKRSAQKHPTPARDEGERTNASSLLHNALACIEKVPGKAHYALLDKAEDDIRRAIAAQSPAQTGGTAVAWATCQACGGAIEGWICQSCGRAFHENDSGDLVMDAAPVAEGAREDSGSLQPQDAASVPTEPVTLRPCPFCGGVNVQPMVDEGQGLKWGRAVCDCGACGPDVRTSYDASASASWRDEAMREWNSRVDPCATHKAAGFFSDPCCPHCPDPAP